MIDISNKQLIAEGLEFPTSLCFDNEGVAYVAESGLSFGGAEPGGRVLRIEADGSHSCLLSGLGVPLNGIVCKDRSLYISEGGNPGRISRLDLDDGKVTVLLDNLPGLGNYQTCMVAFGPDGKLYFSQGALTNHGIIGLDAYELGWLRCLPHNHDIPGYDIELTGASVETANPLVAEGATARTGAFAPFDTVLPKGTRLAGQVPCTASVMRCNEDGSGLELVAWGLRNSYGLGFTPDGRLLAADQSADDRGSRPADNAPDFLYEVKQNAWYGWPDFIGGVPATDERFRSKRGPAIEQLLSNHDQLPPPESPLLAFPVNSAPTKFQVAPTHIEEWAGQIFITLFGDEKPMTGPPGSRVGRSVARIDPADWSLHPFFHGPFARPMDVRFHPRDKAMYVLDFGEFEMRTQTEMNAQAGSGKLWRINL
ncbi:MAG: PQQ-dependent sugar dehydrogenase [Methylobacter sp.]